MIENTYTIDTFPYEIVEQAGVQKRKRGNQGRRNNIRKYKHLMCAFDIEATNDLSINQSYISVSCERCAITRSSI